MKKMIQLSCAFFVSSFALVALADDEPFSGVWKGGGTQFLSYAPNWVGNSVPGRVRSIVDGVSLTNGAWGCTMIFDGTSTWPTDLRTNDTDKKLLLVSTWKMIFRGASLIQNYIYKYQTLRIEAGGGIYIEEDVGHVPYFDNDSSFCIYNASADSHTVTVRNDSTLAPFKFYTVNNATGMRADGWTGRPVLRLEGNGDIKFAGGIQEDSGAYNLEIAQEGSGKTIFDNGGLNCLVFTLTIPESTTMRTILIESGSTLKTRIFGGDNARPLVVNSDCEISGGGTLFFGSGLNDRSNIQIAPGKTLYFNTTMRNNGLTSGQTLGMCVLGGGSMVMGETATNRVNGAVMVEDGSSLRVNAIGAAGASSPLGTGSSITLKGGSSLVYAGTGDVSDRTLTFGVGGGSLVHCGTGNLTLGAVSVLGDSSIVVSNNVTLALSSLSRTAGVLNVHPAPGGKVVVGSGLDAGRAPEWLTYKGRKANVLSDGTIVGPQGFYLIFR